MSCCDDVTQTSATANVTPNPIVRDHDICGYPVPFKGIVGTNYPEFMPVKLGTVVGTVLPAPDGVDAIGIVSSAKVPVVVGKETLTIKTLVAEVKWSDIATATGVIATNAALYWAMVNSLKNVVKYLKY